MQIGFGSAANWLHLAAIRWPWTCNSKRVDAQQQIEDQFVDWQMRSSRSWTGDAQQQIVDWRHVANRTLVEGEGEAVAFVASVGELALGVSDCVWILCNREGCEFTELCLCLVCVL